MARPAGPRPRRLPGRARALGMLRGRRRAGVSAIGVLVVAALVSPLLCWGSTATPSSRETAAVTPVPWQLREGRVEVPPVRAVDAPAVLSSVEAAASAVSAAVQAVVVDAQGRTLVQTPEADRPLLTASLVKLLVVQQLLARSAREPLDPRLERLMQRAITGSDDQAMNVLWDAYGGERLVRDAVRTFGLTGTAPPEVPGQWGEATTTATDLARFLSALDTAPGARTLLRWMRAAEPTAADGFDQRFGLFTEAAGAGVAVKQGWMCCVDRRRQLHSAGVLADGRVVVVLGDASSAVSWPALRRTVDGAAVALLTGTD
jgi:uncharacterized protein YfiM (DUF2279 family)